MILRDQFPDAEIVTWFLGSDQNEQLFAWIRVSLSLGRRMNLDAVVLAMGMEKRNVRSGFTLPEVEPPIAHTRGRSVLRDEVPLPSAPTKEKPVAENRIWFGRDIDVAKLEKTIEKATEDCIAEGRKHRLPVFVDAQNKAERSGIPIVVNNDSDDTEDEGIDESGETCESEDFSVADYEDEPERSSASYIPTKKFGRIHLKTAEALMLNGGRSRLKGKARVSRFVGAAFGIAADIEQYKTADCGCATATRIGDIKRLTSNSSGQKVTGEVRFISYNFAPLRVFCSKHTSIKGRPTAHLLIDDRYVRCDM